MRTQRPTRRRRSKNELGAIHPLRPFEIVNLLLVYAMFALALLGAVHQGVISLPGASVLFVIVTAVGALMLWCFKS